MMELIVFEQEVSSLCSCNRGFHLPMLVGPTYQGFQSLCGYVDRKFSLLVSLVPTECVAGEMQSLEKIWPKVKGTVKNSP